MVKIFENGEYTLLYFPREELHFFSHEWSKEEWLEYAKIQSLYYAFPILKEDGNQVFMASEETIQLLDGQLRPAFNQIAILPEELNYSSKRIESIIGDLRLVFEKSQDKSPLVCASNGKITGIYLLDCPSLYRVKTNVSNVFYFFKKEILHRCHRNSIKLLISKELTKEISISENESISLEDIEKISDNQEIINLSYSQHIIDCFYCHKSIKTFNNFYGELIMDIAVDFLKSNNIHFSYIVGPDKTRTQLSRENENDLVEHIPLRDLANHKDIIDRAFPKNKRTRDHLLSNGAVSYPIYFNGVHNAIGDFQSKNINIINGHRIVKNAPIKGENTIYIFGACDVFGATTIDNQTVPFYYQSLLNKEYGSFFRVENCGVGGRSLDFDVFAQILSTPFKKGDYVLLQFYFNDKTVDYLKKLGVPIYNLSSLFSYKHTRNRFSLGHIAHVNEKMNKKIADFYFNNIPLFRERSSDIADYGLSSFFIEDYGLTEYLKKLKALGKKYPGNNGAIVMSGNPFTLGHLKLVEYALGLVDHLFVFVVTIDNFAFPFEERHLMAMLALKNYERVSVVSSGAYFGTMLTFGEYAIKDEKNKSKLRQIHPEKDILIFGKYIAPALNIKTRFVGEENEDNLTRLFNESLNKELPKYGLTLKVIPRFEVGGMAISAKKIRRLISEKKFETVKDYVPYPVYEYLKNKKW